MNRHRSQERRKLTSEFPDEVGICVLTSADIFWANGIDPQRVPLTFAQHVLKAWLGANWESYAGSLFQIHSTPSFSASVLATRNLKRQYGIVYDYDRVGRLHDFGPKHYWLQVGDLHFDSLSPKGVKSFLELRAHSGAEPLRKPS